MSGRDSYATSKLDPATRAAFGRLAEAWSKAPESFVAALRLVPPMAPPEALAAAIAKVSEGLTPPPEALAAVAKVADLRWMDSLMAESEQLPPCALVDDLPEPGRPKGQKQAETECALAALNRLLKTAEAGADPTTVARGIFEGLGYTGQQVKNKADHLVKVFKRSLGP